MKKQLTAYFTNASIRSLLAIIWSIAAIRMLWYILVNYGQEKEILTLLIGLVGGTIIGNIFGTYFAASYRKPVNEQNNEHTN